jgi:protein TonB
MNKSLWHSDIFRAACASVALHAGIAGVMVLSISMAAPHFFRFVESPKVLHVSWISAQMDLAEPEGIIKKAKPQAPGSSAIQSPTPALPREKKDKPSATTAQEVSVRPESQTISLSLPTGVNSKDAQRTGEHPVLARMSLPGSAERSGPYESASVATPRYRENAHPVYPAVARLKGYEGVVLLTAEVFADGRVGSLTIKKSSGYASLDRSALEAVKRWKFEPGRKMGKPVIMWVDVPVKFVLKEDDPIS